MSWSLLYPSSRPSSALSSFSRRVVPATNVTNMAGCLRGASFYLAVIPVAPFKIWPRNLCPPERSCQLLPYTLGGGLEGDVEIVENDLPGVHSRKVQVGLGSRSRDEASDGPLGEDWPCKDAISHFFEERQNRHLVDWPTNT